MPARSMADVIRAHDHGGTDPASWRPGNPIRWACFGPECDAVDEGTDMHLSLTDWYAGHLAEELEKAGFGDLRTIGAAPESRETCDGSPSCPAGTHIHGCFSGDGEEPDADADDSGTEPPAEFR